MAKRNTASKAKVVETKAQEADAFPAQPERSRTLMEQVRYNMDRVREAFRADPLFLDNPEELETGTAVAAWAMLDLLLSAIKYRKDLYRAELLKRAECDGVPTDKGGNRLWIDDSEVIREKRKDKLPREDALRNLLASKGIPFSEAFDEVKVLKINPSKVDYLIQTGRLSQKEVDDLCKVTYALKVKESELLEKVLVDCQNALLGLPAGTKRLKSD